MRPSFVVLDPLLTVGLPPGPTAATGMDALVHGIAHAVTNHTGAAHGLALSAVLADVMTRTADAAGDAYAEVATAMGAAEPCASAAVDAVSALADAVGARRRLDELGVTVDMVPAVARGAVQDAVTVNHPRAVDEVADVVSSYR